MTKLFKLVSVGILGIALTGAPSLTASAETIEIPADKEDDVTAELVAGIKAYLDGNVAEAKSTLEFAVQLISQLKAEGLNAFLPAALSSDWSREDGDTEAMGAAMFGGGISASARYVKGGKECTISIMGDSPMIQSFSMMFANPAIAASAGNTVKRINGERVIISNDEEIHAILNNFFLQYGGDCAIDDKIKYVEATDFKGLKEYQ